jgi:hypothetical protein
MLASGDDKTEAKKKKLRFIDERSEVVVMLA